MPRSLGVHVKWLWLDKPWDLPGFEARDRFAFESFDQPLIALITRIQENGFPSYQCNPCNQWLKLCEDFHFPVSPNLSRVGLWLMRRKRCSPPRYGVPVHFRIEDVTAGSRDETRVAAEACGKADEILDDPSMTTDDRPSKLVFAGIRKIVAFATNAGQLKSGGEMSYNELALENAELFRKFLSGQEAVVTIA